MFQPRKPMRKFLSIFSVPLSQFEVAISLSLLRKYQNQEWLSLPNQTLNSNVVNSKMDWDYLGKIQECWRGRIWDRREIREGKAGRQITSNMAWTLGRTRCLQSEALDQPPSTYAIIIVKDLRCNSNWVKTILFS